MYDEHASDDILMKLSPRRAHDYVDGLRGSRSSGIKLMD